MKKQIETSISTISQLDNGIIRVEMKPNIEIDTSGLKENLDFYRSILKGEKTYFLAIFHELNTAALDIRSEFEKLGRVSIKEAEAFVVSSLSNRIELEFFTQKTKTIYPTKVFNQEAEAISWLEELM